MTRLLRWADPLQPAPDEARSWLRRELLRPEYNEQNIVQRVLDAIIRAIDTGLEAASDAPPLTTLAAMAVLAAVAVGTLALVSRARQQVRTKKEEPGPVLTDEQVTARELRARAEAALAAGRPGIAVVEGFRALTLRQVERHRLEDLPGSTAHEVAGILGTTYAPDAPRIAAAADLFDAVLYGDHPATEDGARSVLDLDDALAPGVLR